jgi:recombination protein RecR
VKRFLEGLIAELSKLPGVGEKSAERMALFLLKRGQNENESLATFVRDLKRVVHPCPVCGNYAEAELCEVCSATDRDRTQLCVVEEARYIRILEKTRVFRGVYHVLGGVISPVHGIGPDELNIKTLVKRMEGGGIREIILALNQTTEAELTGLYLAKLLKPFDVSLSRLTAGVPVGADLEFIDVLTLSKSFEGRQKV